MIRATTDIADRASLSCSVRTYCFRFRCCVLVCDQNGRPMSWRSCWNAFGGLVLLATTSWTVRLDLATENGYQWRLTSSNGSEWAFLGLVLGDHLLQIVFLHYFLEAIFRICSYKDIVSFFSVNFDNTSNKL